MLSEEFHRFVLRERERDVVRQQCGVSEKELEEVRRERGRETRASERCRESV